MEIRDMRMGDLSVVHALLCANGWATRIGSVERLARLIAHSQRTAVVIEAGALVGFARGLTDYLSNGYLSMIVVAPTHRRRGIGRLLVTHIMGDDPAITWVVRADRPGAGEFFARLGFSASEVAMERRRS